MIKLETKEYKIRYKPITFDGNNFEPIGFSPKFKWLQTYITLDDRIHFDLDYRAAYDRGSIKEYKAPLYMDSVKLENASMRWLPTDMAHGNYLEISIPRKCPSRKDDIEYNEILMYKWKKD